MQRSRIEIRVGDLFILCETAVQRRQCAEFAQRTEILRQHEKYIRFTAEQILIDGYERFYRLAYSYVQNREDALDVVQESACKAICQCNSLKDPSKLYSWICRIVVNTTMDLLRSRKKEDMTGELPDQASEDVYQETDLKNALESLEPQNRTIVILRYCEDMKLEDIALAVNENLNTVKTRLYRSLKKLRINLEAPDTN